MDTYEKKYNEALERARANYKADKEMGFLENCNMLELIFPELAESEDERIRAVILRLVLGMRNEIFTTADKLVTKPKVLAWLEKQKEPTFISDLHPDDKGEPGENGIPEKQKESLHIPETCKENADSFTDACKDVIVAIEEYLDWLTGYPDYAPKGKYSIRDMLYCLFVLEKQKEQKPIKRPKFKIGDVVKFKGFGNEPADDTPLKIVGYDNELYLFDNGTTDLFSEQNLYELVEQKSAEIAPNQFDGITYGMQGCSTEKSAERFEEAREKYQVEWSEEYKPIPQEEFDAAKHESLWGEQKPAGWKQGKRIEVGNKVKIHCREDRNKDMLSIYNDKVGEVISIWDAQRNPWGPIIVRLDNGCNNGFYEDELDIFDEPPILEKHC